MTDIDAIVSGAVRHLQAAINLPDEARPAQPFVLRQGAEYLVSAGFYHAEVGLVRGRPRQFWFPTVQFRYDVARKLYSHQKLDPTAFGVVDPARPFGDLGYLAGVTMDQYRAATARHQQLLGEIVDRRALDRPAAASRETSAIAAEMRGLIAMLREPALHSYYAAYAAELDRWLSS